MAFGYVLMSLWKMTASTMRVKDLEGISPTFKLNPLSLGLILAAVVGSWLLFPTFILAYKADMLSLYQAEALLARLNFCTKVSLFLHNAVVHIQAQFKHWSHAEMMSLTHNIR